MLDAAPPPLLLVVLALAVLVGLRLALKRLGAPTRRVARWLPSAASRAPGWPVALRVEAGLRGRWPRSMAFVTARLSVRHFTGLPLSVILAALALLAIVFSELAEEILEQGEVVAFDVAVLAAFEPLRTAPAIRMFAWITDLGDNVTLTVASVVALGFFATYGRFDLLLGFTATVAGSQAMLWAAKLGFDRVRPELLTEVTASSPSFPSGHATSAMAIYGFLAYAFARLASDPGRRFEILFWTAVLILLIGFSRILLHVHYPSDVLAGLVTGAVWLLVGAALAEWLAARPARP